MTNNELRNMFNSYILKDYFEADILGKLCFALDKIIDFENFYRCYDECFYIYCESQKINITIKFEINIKDFLFEMYKDTLGIETLDNLIFFTSKQICLFIKDYIENDL